VTLLDIKHQVMFQIGSDAGDLGDFQPHITRYINEGYDRACMAWTGRHVGAEDGEVAPLRSDRAVPDVPEWLHAAIADWAAWLIYRNGNSARQNRGYPFRSAALDAFRRAESRGRYITNIPR